MNKTVKNFIRFELRCYPITKEALAKFDLGQLVSPKELFWSWLIVQGIERTLEQLPAEVQDYVRLRYFNPGRYTLEGLALKLNVAERTVRIWDQEVITKIAQQVGIFRD